MISVLLRIIINLENLTPATQDLSEIDDIDRSDSDLRRRAGFRVRFDSRGSSNSYFPSLTRDAQDVSNSCVQYESLSPDKRLARLSEEYRGGLTILEGILCLALWRGSGNLRVIRRVAFGGEEVLDESISLPRDLELSLSGQEVLL